MDPLHPPLNAGPTPSPPGSPAASEAPRDDTKASLLHQFGAAVSTWLDAAREAVDESNSAINERYQKRLLELRDKGELSTYYVLKSFAALGRAKESLGSLQYSRRQNRHRVKVRACPELGSSSQAGTPAVSDDEAESKPSPSAASFLSQGGPQLSSAGRRYTPCTLIDDAFIIDRNGRKHPIGRNIWDSGSALTLMGEGDFRRFEKLGCARKAPALPSSIRRVHGIGADHLVLYHARFVVSLGGAEIEFLDVPVLANHSGLLFGNDLLWSHNFVL